VRLWKKSKEPISRRGLQQCVLQGASREELLQEALAELASSGAANRFGVWLEPAAEDRRQEDVLRGSVWDSEIAAPPREWQWLAPQTVLSPRLFSGSTMEVDLARDAALPIVGPLAGLRRAFWAPVQQAGKLRGVLLAGTHGTRTDLPRKSLLELSSKLAVALAFESERDSSNERHADNALCGKILSSLQTQTPRERLLQEIVESCLARASRSHSPGAVFAAVAKTRRSETPGYPKIALEFFCTAGKSDGNQFAALEDVKTLVRSALESGRTAAAEVRHASVEGSLHLIVVPLPVRGKREDVLLAAFRIPQSSLAFLDRLELRGSLAASVLSAMEEQEIEASEEQQKKAILEASTDAMVQLSASGAVTASNHSARNLLFSPLHSSRKVPRTEEPDLPGVKMFSQFFCKEDRDQVSSWQRNRVGLEGPESKESPEVELDSGIRVRLRSHRIGDLSQIITLLPTATPAGVDGKRAEAELLNLAEWLDQGVILYDEYGNVRLLNLQFAQMAGLAPEELKRCMTLEGLIARLRDSAANPEVFAQRWKELAKPEKGGEREEVNFVRPVARVLERASRPVFDDVGKQIGRIELYKDLTAQSVFQSKLLQTERLAALGQMVSGVAHELSNPLTSILGYAQRLLLRNDVETNYEEIRKIFGEAERASAILRRMLLASRETVPERRLFSLNQIVQRTIDLQRFSLAAERIRVDVSLDAMLPMVSGDAGQLQQVLINLFGNARQAIESQDHGGTIRVRTWSAEDGRVRLEVSDSGPGIPEGIMARIFDPFFTTKPAGVGTGLGLSIVLSLVREHGGQVTVSSPRGGGAIFLVELPSAERQETAERAVQPIPFAQSALLAKTENVAPARKPLGTRRVLIVEDEPIVAQLISDVLRDEGFEIEVHLDGRNALERASRERFDLIICDMKLPNLDGRTLYQALSADEEGLPRRFLFVTGDVRGGKTHEFLAKHQLSYVAKPFRVEELLEKVHLALQPTASSGWERMLALCKNSASVG
jgi:signal transduction histidine kinase/AmiR/NasT family two-component response regulator